MSAKRRIRTHKPEIEAAGVHTSRKEPPSTESSNMEEEEEERESQSPKEETDDRIDIEVGRGG